MYAVCVCSLSPCPISSSLPPLPRWPSATHAHLRVGKRSLGYADFPAATVTWSSAKSLISGWTHLSSDYFPQNYLTSSLKCSKLRTAGRHHYGARQEMLIETENCCLEIFKPTRVLWNASSVQLCQLFTAYIYEWVMSEKYMTERIAEAGGVETLRSRRMSTHQRYRHKGAPLLTDSFYEGFEERGMEYKYVLWWPSGAKLWIY